MKKILVSTSVLALLVASPASAQLIGGGGGLGIGGFGGGIMGGISTTVSRTGADVGAATRTTTRIPRADRQVKPPKPAANAGGAATVLNGRAAAGLTGSVDTATRQVNAAANVTAKRPNVFPAVPVPALAVPAVSVPAVSMPAVAVPAVRAPGVSLGYIGGPDVAVLGRRQVMIDDGVVFIPRHEVTYYVDAQEQVLRRDLAGTGASVERRGKLLVIELPSDVNFAFDKYDIQPRFLPVLKSVARTLNSFPATYIDVIGHTDAIGTDGYNQRLSERRASSVAGYLVHRRANPDRLFVAGEGEHEPVASNASITGRAANRRVEIILTPHEG